MKINLFILFFLLFIKVSVAQLQFEFTWKGKRIELEKVYLFANNDSIQFSELKCYLSNISLVDQKNKVSTIAHSYFLVDLEDTNSLVLNSGLDILKYKRISLTFGLDSSVNNSGNIEGVLDPIHGMYWAWNSGYIHSKIIGKSNRVPTKKQEFEFHIGGFRAPNQTYFNLELPISGNKIQLELAPFFDNLDLKNENQLMIPGKKAHDFAQSLAALISIK
jgi:hypothetical protein